MTPHHGVPQHAGPGHPFYDHTSVEGDATSDLRDALVARGWDAIIAHTGGGCMAVGVVLSDGPARRYALVGTDHGVATSLADSTQGGADCEVGGHYVGSMSWTCDPGHFVESCEDALRAMRDGSAVLR